jgi:hypothetical protein
MTAPDDRPHRPRERGRGGALAIALLVVALLTLFIAGGSLPPACGSCHAMHPYATGLSSSTHSTVACYSCHLPSGDWSWPGFKAAEVLEMYPAASTGATLTAPGDRVPRTACLACHASVLDGTVLQAKGLRIAHASCAASGGCDACHGDVAHGTAVRWSRRPDMDVCLACHLQRSATVVCDSCHAKRTQASRLATGVWRSTHGPEWATTHGKGDISLCRACHATTFCIGCHGIALPHPTDFTNVHGGYSQVASARCTECHDRATFCDACHGVPMPHPAGYLMSHATTTRSLTDPRCSICHLQSQCAACHKGHTHPTKTKGTLGTFPLPGIKP